MPPTVLATRERYDKIMRYGLRLSAMTIFAVSHDGSSSWNIDSPAFGILGMKYPSSVHRIIRVEIALIPAYGSITVLSRKRQPGWTLVIQGHSIPGYFRQLRHNSSGDDVQQILLPKVNFKPFSWWDLAYKILI